MRVKSRIILSHDIPINCSFEKLNKVISELDQKSFEIHELKKGKFKFLANFSLGTTIINGYSGIIDGIKVYGEILKASDSTSILKISTKIRIELIFICACWIGITLFQLLGNDRIPIWVNLILFPCIILWFWFVFRIQEKLLLNKIEEKLNNTLKSVEK